MKEKIFNEWGAVLKHQDEIDDQIKRDDQAKMKLRQIKYRAELDNQVQSSNQRQINSKMQAKRTDQQLLNYLQQKDTEKSVVEDQKKELLKKAIQENAANSLQDKNRQLLEHRDKIRQDQDQFRNQILQQQENERQRKLDELKVKYQDQNSYYQELMAQQNFKKFQEQKIKDDDRIYSKLEENESQKFEQNRQQYFENLKKYQDMNDQKLQQLSNFLNQGDLHQLSKQDEERYIKAMEEKEVQARKREDDDARKQLKTKQLNMQGLNYQLMQKEMEKKMKELDEQKYAEQVKTSAFHHQQMEEYSKEQAKQKQKSYLESLTKQITEQQHRKKYDSLMTEHERRVNDRDIKAYEQQDTKNLYGKLPGFKSYDQNVQERYLEKIFTNQPIQNYGGVLQQQELQQQQYNQDGQTLKVPTPYQQLPYINQSPSPNLLKAQKQKSQLVIGAENQIHNINHSLDASTIREVQKNMEQPQALMYRHNTGNRLYGFDQTLHKESPIPQFANPEDPSYSNYKFTVAGNYKH